MPIDGSMTSRFILERELERGWWWSARDRETCRTVVCTIADLSASEREALDDVRKLTRGWANVAPLCGIENRFDGTTLIAYSLAPGHRYTRADDGPLNADEARGVADALGFVLARAHDLGIVHPGLTSAAVELAISADGRLETRLRGLGLPVHPLREPSDDVADLAAIVTGLLAKKAPEVRRRSLGQRILGGTNPGMINALRAYDPSAAIAR